MKEYDDYNEEHISKSWKQYLDAVDKVNPLLEKAFEIIKDKNNL